MIVLDKKMLMRLIPALLLLTLMGCDSGNNIDQSALIDSAINCTTGVSGESSAKSDIYVMDSAVTNSKKTLDIINSSTVIFDEGFKTSNHIYSNIYDRYNIFWNGTDLCLYENHYRLGNGVYQSVNESDKLYSLLKNCENYSQWEDYIIFKCSNGFYVYDMNSQSLEYIEGGAYFHPWTQWVVYNGIIYDIGYDEDITNCHLYKISIDSKSVKELNIGDHNLKGFPFVNEQGDIVVLSEIMGEDAYHLLKIRNDKIIENRAILIPCDKGAMIEACYDEHIYGYCLDEDETVLYEFSYSGLKELARSVFSEPVFLLFKESSRSTKFGRHMVDNGVISFPNFVISSRTDNIKYRSIYLSDLSMEPYRQIRITMDENELLMRSIIDGQYLYCFIYDSNNCSVRVQAFFIENTW